MDYICVIVTDVYTKCAHTPSHIQGHTLTYTGAHPARAELAHTLGITSPLSILARH